MALSKHALDFTAQMDAQVASVETDFLSKHGLSVLDVVRQGTWKKSILVIPDEDTDSKFYLKHFHDYEENRNKQRERGELREAEERFKYEIAVMKQLSHPSLHTEHVACRCNDHWFIIFHKNVHQTLNQYVEEDPEEDDEHGITDKMFVQVACGVLYMHHKGYAHLKIIPHNIFLDEFYNAKIANFETTQAVVDANNSVEAQAPLPKEASATSTENCTKVSPPASRDSRFTDYMAPEYLKEDVNGYKLDMHALGGVLFHMLRVTTKSSTPVFYSAVMDGKVPYIPSRYRKILPGLINLRAEDRWNGKELREGIRKEPELEELFQRYMHVKDSDLCLRE